MMRECLLSIYTVIIKMIKTAKMQEDVLIAMAALKSRHSRSAAVRAGSKVPQIISIHLMDNEATWRFTGHTEQAVVLPHVTMR